MASGFGFLLIIVIGGMFIMTSPLTLPLALGFFFFFRKFVARGSNWLAFLIAEGLCAALIWCIMTYGSTANASGDEMFALAVPFAVAAWILIISLVAAAKSPRLAAAAS